MPLSLLTQEPAEVEVEQCVAPPSIVDMSKMSRAERVIFACDGIIDLAAAFFNVSSKELREQGRSVMSISRVRQIAMYVAHVELGFTMREVGDGFGRERTTVLHACHQVEDMRDDADFDAIVASMERLVGRAFGRNNGETGFHERHSEE